ncbi:MAG TPA: energy transducer TonB [Terriglobales bacterium]|nr:energy transducer TonB [Terriglobales bacterium]
MLCRTQILFLAAIIVGCISPSPAEMPTSSGEVVMVTLSDARYPPLPRTANITGDVEIRLEVLKDGSVKSAAVLSGHPLLTDAALNSAQHSRYECRGCTDEVTSHVFVYSFRVDAPASKDWACKENTTPHIAQSGDHITIAMEPRMVHPYFGNINARSLKCLDLWRCGYRWGGIDYYYYPVRSVKCLGLWKCGLHLREPFYSCNQMQKNHSSQ